MKKRKLRYIINVSNLDIKALFKIRGGATSAKPRCELSMCTELACVSSACDTAACWTDACETQACNSMACSSAVDRP